MRRYPHLEDTPAKKKKRLASWEEGSLRVRCHILKLRIKCIWEGKKWSIVSNMAEKMSKVEAAEDH